MILDTINPQEPLTHLALANWDSKVPGKEIDDLSNLMEIVSLINQTGENQALAKDRNIVIRKCWNFAKKAHSPIAIELCQKIRASSLKIIFKEQIELPPESIADLTQESAYFEKLLIGGFTEMGENTITIQDISKKEFEKLLDLTCRKTKDETPQDVIMQDAHPKESRILNSKLQNLLTFYMTAHQLQMQKAIALIAEELKVYIGSLKPLVDLETALMILNEYCYLLPTDDILRNALSEYFNQCVAKLKTREELASFLIDHGKHLRGIGPFYFPLNDNDVDLIIKCCPILTKISFKFADITDISINRVIDRCPLLQELDLTYCIKITNLQRIEKLTNLQVLCLQDCNIADDGLKSVFKLTKLRSLNLDIRSITDKTLEGIEKLINLKWLSLSGSKITDKSLAEIYKLTNLEWLNLDICSTLSDEGFNGIEKLINLKWLSVYGCKINDKILGKISKLPLESLNLRECTLFTDQGLKTIATMASLKSLSLKECTQLTSIGLESLSPMLALEELILSGCKVDQILQKLLGKLKNLKKLELALCENITNSDLEGLEGLTYLEELNLMSCKNLTDKSFALLGKLIKLKKLFLSYTQISCLKGFEKLINLQELFLHGCINLKESELVRIVGFKNLKELSLEDCSKIDHISLACIGQLSSLESLNLTNTNITDEGLEEIENLINLKELNIARCNKITNKGMEFIGKLMNLEGLDLMACINLTDESLPHIANLVNLNTLFLTDCEKLTSQGIKCLLCLKFLKNLFLSGYNLVNEETRQEFEKKGIYVQ